MSKIRNPGRRAMADRLVGRVLVEGPVHNRAAVQAEESRQRCALRRLGSRSAIVLADFLTPARIGPTRLPRTFSQTLRHLPHRLARVEEA